MPFTEEIVQASYKALLDCNIVHRNSDNQFTISENFDNHLSDFLTMLQLYELPVAIWNFHNGRYPSVKDISKAVLQIASTEELLRDYCPSCEKKAFPSSNCLHNENAYKSLQHFTETKILSGQEEIARDLIQTALTILKKSVKAYLQTKPPTEEKIERPDPQTFIDSQEYCGKVHLGIFYYREYYPKTFSELNKCHTGYFINQNKFLCNLKLSQYNNEIDQLNLDQRLKTSSYPGHHFCFDAVTIGDGFLYGAGIPHDFGIPQVKRETRQDQKLNAELLLGMYFDHTSGLPVLPGESLKGALRSVFKEQPMVVLDNLIAISGIKEQNKINFSMENLNDLENELFEYPNEPTGQRDQFLLSYPITSQNKEQRFLGMDTITPHNDSPLKSPNASIPFLKVLPNVVYRFNLILNDGIIKKEEKYALIKQLINDFGLGAKSRRGFGRFRFIRDVDLNEE